MKNTPIKVSVPADIKEAFSALEIQTKLAMQANELAFSIRETEVRLAGLKTTLDGIRKEYVNHEAKIRGAMAPLDAATLG